MKKLLEIEWLKVKNYRTFWVLMILFVVAMVGINLIAFKINSAIRDSNPMISAMMGGPYGFPEVWKTVGWMTGWLLYFPGFIMIFLVSNEFVFKTHRQNIIDGLTRQQFVSVKLIMALLLAFLCTVMMVISALIFGFASGSKWEGGNFQFIGYFFINSYIYVLFGLTLALLLRKAALAVGIYFIYGLVFDNIIAAFISNRTNSALGTYIAPLQVSDSLFPVPFIDKILPNQPEKWILLTICAAWIIFYNFFPIKKFNTEDL